MQELASILANEILKKFKETFQDKDFSSSIIKNSIYLSFSNKIYDCIQSLIKGILIRRNRLYT